MIRSVISASKWLRAAKKKSGPVEVNLGTDITNIFLDRTDPEDKPIEEYPPWVKDLVYFEETHPAGVLAGMYRGEEYLISGVGQRRIDRWCRRTKLRIANGENYKPPVGKKWVERKRMLDIEPKDGTESEDDPEGHLESYLRVALGAPVDAEVERI